MPDETKTAENSAGQSGLEVERAGRRGPLQQGGEGRGGALTGETGVFTTDSVPDSVEPFVSAETREYSDPVLRGHVTEASKDASELHRRQVEAGVEAGDGGEGLGEGSDGAVASAGQLSTERASGLTGLMAQNHAMGASTSAQAGTQQGSGATELASQEGGYGSSRGLDPNDPAYRMDDRTVGEESPDS